MISVTDPCKTDTRARRPRASRAMAAALLMAVGLAACEPVIRSHGYAPTSESLSDIVVGRDTASMVAQKIGRPSTIGTFDNSSWYYVSSEIEKRSLRGDKVLDRKVVVIDFDDQQRVADIGQYGLEDGQVIDLVTRTTPTRGRRLTVVQQLLGNLGRFEGNSPVGGGSGL